MRRLVMSRSTATLRDANRPSYTTVVSFKSEISGRTSPDLSSDMNGSRPPPSYANTSRISDCGAAAAESRSCAATGPASATPTSASASATAASPRLAARTRRSRGLGRRRCRRLHERPNGEFAQEQRTRRVAEQLLRGRRCRREHHVLRLEDARQRRDVGGMLADLVVMPVDLEQIAVRIEEQAGLGEQRLNFTDRDSPPLS